MRFSSLLFLTFAIWSTHFVSEARADRLYIGDSRDIVLKDGSSAELKLLYGDGILFNDPVQAIIVNDVQQVVAAGPVSSLLYILCGLGAEAMSCLVYDPFVREVFTPDERSFGMIGILGNNDPTFHPDDGLAAGFSSRPATLWEAASFELLHVLDNPIGFVFLVFWLALVWFLVLWTKVRPRYWTAVDVSVWVAASLGKLLYALLLLAILAYSWVMNPFSGFRLVLAAVIAGSLMLALKVWQRRLITGRPPNQRRNRRLSA